MKKHKKSNRKTVLSWKKNSSDPLEAMIADTDQSWYLAKHPKRTEKETAFIASLKPECCPRCGSKEFIKYGSRKGIPIFKCKACPARFKALSMTIFASAKIPIAEW